MSSVKLVKVEGDSISLIGKDLPCSAFYQVPQSKQKGMCHVVMVDKNADNVIDDSYIENSNHVRLWTRNNFESAYTTTEKRLLLQGSSAYNGIKRLLGAAQSGILRRRQNGILGHVRDDNGITLKKFEAANNAEGVYYPNRLETTNQVEFSWSPTK